MSHPNGLPDLFLGRSLGRKVVPTILRAEGLRLITLSEHYGIPVDETIDDDEWLELAGTSELAVLGPARLRATAHGHRGDTIDISYTLIDTSTTHRGLYVGATRARAEDHLLVVTDEPEPTEARDVFEFVLSNDRADVPVIV